MTQKNQGLFWADGGNIPAGIAMMLLGIFMFAANDALGKWLVGTYSVGQVLLFRSIAALVVLSPFIWRKWRTRFLRAPRPGLQLLRVVFSTVEVACSYKAVASLPLAEVITYYLAGPIYVTALSRFFLSEAVGRKLWAAVLVGFLGVLIALAPSPESLSWGALLSLIGSFSFACLMVTTRKVAGTDGTVLVSAQIVAALLFGAALAPVGWVTPSPAHVGLIGLVGIVSLGAYLCVNLSLRLAPASIVVPYQYTLIVWGAVLGYLVFGDVPSAATMLGATIIIGAGLFIFFNERPAASRLEPSAADTTQSQS